MRLHKLAQKGAMPSDGEWEALHQFMFDNISDFCIKINGDGLGLTDKEKIVCILTKLRFIPTEIAVLLDTTKQNVTNIRGSINRKIFHANGTKTFDANIRKM